MRTPLLGLIRFYQYAISPLLGVACRYEPTCSRYGYEAIESHGARRGILLTVRRLARCRPGGGSGFDPVPPRLDNLDHTPSQHSPSQHAAGQHTAGARAR